MVCSEEEAGVPSLQPQPGASRSRGAEGGDEEGRNEGRGRGFQPLSQLPRLGRHFADLEPAPLQDSPDEKPSVVRERDRELEAGRCWGIGTLQAPVSGPAPH